MGWRYERADYRWLLLSDPPVCRAGPPDVVLNNCDLLRRGKVCWCRFESQEIVEDVEAVGAPGAADDWLTTGDLDPRDVEDFRDAIAAIAERARRMPDDHPRDDDASAALERLDALVTRLGRLVERESGLSDRFADDVEA